MGDLYVKRMKWRVAVGFVCKTGEMGDGRGIRS